MAHDLERLIRSAYGRWKIKQKPHGSCPDEDAFAAFLEQKLPENQARLFMGHIAACDQCAELLAAHIRAAETQDAELPEELFQWTRNLLEAHASESALQIIVKAKDRLLELVSTNADVLVGQELVPAALLRSRKVKDFPDEIVALKDFDALVVQVSVRAREQGRFDVAVLVKVKQTQKPAEDLRISLIRGEVELESSVCEAGKAVFEHIEPGKYLVEVSSVVERVALIRMEITV